MKIAINNTRKAYRILSEMLKKNPPRTPNENEEIRENTIEDVKIFQLYDGNYVWGWIIDKFRADTVKFSGETNTPLNPLEDIKAALNPYRGLTIDMNDGTKIEILGCSRSKTV